MLRFFAGLIALGALTSGLQAKELKRTIEGKVGQDTRIGLFGSLSPECRPERTPPVRIAHPPSHGTIIVGTGLTKVPDNVACAGTSFTVLAIFYRPSEGFDGEDQTTLEFEYNAENKQTHVVDLIIRR